MHLRNFFYDTGVLKSIKFNVPVICVGNLSTGGTGKTPLVEFLTEHINSNSNAVVLSRGYGRKSKGFIEVSPNSDATIVGDEPLQIKQKFKTSKVFVCENRVHGINNILEQNKNTEAVILDDAFQHRAVIAGLNIVVTAFQDLYINDFVLPAGNLREPRSGIKRAQVVVVSKCPRNLTQVQKSAIEKQLALSAGQQLFFSFLTYQPLQSLFTDEKIPLAELKHKDILLFTAIASPHVLINFLLSLSHSVEPINFPDHHYFTNENLQTVTQKFDIIASPHKIIVCTEKDAVKLRDEKINTAIKNLPLYFLPVKATFENDEEVRFKSTIDNYVRKN